MQNPSIAGPPSLRTKQIIGLKQLINFNQPIPNTLAAEPAWKVLIYDRFGQDILSPLLSLKELRELGVTLHLLLHKEREALEDVPAVYFVSPTEENVSRLCRDLASGLYESYYFNFIGTLSRPRLEELATATVQTNSVGQVQKIFDQYLNFICLEDDLFTLRRHDDSNSLSYYGINRSDVGDVEMYDLIDQIVDGLFSACVTFGSVPVIRCPKGNAAELVAERLDRKLRDNLRDARNNLFTGGDNLRSAGGGGQFSFQRPVLIILDRTMDLATPLHHTWSYQALVHDVLELDSNRVVLPETAGTQGGKRGKKEYDLNVHDKFWSAQKGSPFPAVAEAVQVELEAYRNSEDEIKRLKNAMGLEAESEEAVSLIGDTTAQLTSTVSSLPELLERKRLIDLHTNVATAVLDQIKARKLDAFFEAEEKLMSKQLPDRSLLEMIKDPECGSADDKLRLFLIHFICSDVADNDLAQFVTALEAAGCDTAAVKYVKRWKAFAKRISRDQYSGGGTKTVSMFSKLLSQSSQFVMEGVKNLVVKKHNLPVTRIVDAIMEMKALPETDEYRYFDPKLLRSTSETVPKNKAPFNDAIIFVIGGGNYVEYQNLVDYKKAKSSGGQGVAGSSLPKRITYGCTELVNADQFLTQLQKLGEAV